MPLHDAFKDTLASTNRVDLNVEVVTVHQTQVSGRIAGELVSLPFKGKNNQSRARSFAARVVAAEDLSAVDLITAIHQAATDTAPELRELHFSLAVAILGQSPK